MKDNFDRDVGGEEDCVIMLSSQVRGKEEGRKAERDI